MDNLDYKNENVQEIISYFWRETNPVQIYNYLQLVYRNDKLNFQNACKSIIKYKKGNNDKNLLNCIKNLEIIMLEVI